jgi:hypothetical protein
MPCWLMSVAMPMNEHKRHQSSRMQSQKCATDSRAVRLVGGWARDALLTGGCGMARSLVIELPCRVSRTSGSP